MTLVFVDTDVLVYARDSAEPDKGRLARSWMERLWQTRAGRLSWQVLQEYYQTVTAKLKPGIDPAQARRDVVALSSWQPVVVDQAVLEHAWSVQDRYSLSWWDALIVAAADLAGCEYLLTEDLQDDQRLGDLRVISPFTADPIDVLASEP
jgi:predicted nucleic acid-binding protein